MWQGDEAVEVRCGSIDGVDAPEQFLWRGRLWRVCALQAHWVETAAWWDRRLACDALGAGAAPDRAGSTGGRSRSARADAVAGLAVAGLAGAGLEGDSAVGVLEDDGWGPQRAVYRVQAGSGRHGRREVFDLAFDPDSGRWQLERVTER